MTQCMDCLKVLEIGDFPFCPHEPTKLAVVGDDVPGGFWAENGFETPRKFYSKSEHVAALAAEGLEQRVKWAGPGDQHVSRWDAVSQHQLDAATELVTRPSRRVRPESGVTLTESMSEETFRVQVPRCL